MSFLQRKNDSAWKRALRHGALVLGALATFGFSHAAQAQTVGVVDGVKINDGYTKLKSALEGIDKRKQELRAQLDARAFLGEADARRFDALIVKDKRTDAENADLTKMVGAGTERQNEYKNLIGKANKSEPEKTRIKQLEDDAQKTGPAFQEIVAKVDAAISKQEVDTEETYRNSIIKVVEQVATEKKLVVVVGKQAIAWNSGTIDITDEVLSRLNKA